MSRRAEFEEFVEENLPRFYRYEQKLCGDPHLAWDLVQEACLKLWLSNGPLAMPYMYRILRNVFYDYLRKKDRRPEKLVEDLVCEGPRFYSEDDTLDIDDALHEAIDKLPEQMQMAIYLSYDEGRKPAEVAKIMGLRADQVSRYLNRARTKLRRELSVIYAERQNNVEHRASE
ncbi:sigma-70 family RNA polymerase sigma factor [Nocardia vinacea]|uniref:RNA polymerase sigma factor n=1 Tax=Nocardia vinacea TaxID=96468 RepID=UPI003426BC7B